MLIPEGCGGIRLASRALELARHGAAAPSLLIPEGWGDPAWPHAIGPGSGGVRFEKRSLEKPKK